MFLYFGSVLILVALVHCSPIDENSSVEYGTFTSNDFFNEEDVDIDPRNRFQVIFPGTKWCGPGDKANDYDDLGILKETDMCCRDHDFCDSMPAGTSKYGLTNNTPFTKLHCDCDKTFSQCLKKVAHRTANSIGKMYSLGNKQCYKEEYPIIGCEQYVNHYWKRRCIKYRLDDTQPKLYQFFDLPFY